MKSYLNNLSTLKSWRPTNLTLNAIINFGFLVCGVLILIGPALQNGFPILHSDSGTYLLEGFGNKIPVSRPLSYCLFVRFSSSVFSIWSVVIFQALMAYWMIWLTVNILTDKKDTAWLPFLVVAILSITTGISYYVSQIMPDIFLPIALLAVFVVLQREKLAVYSFILISVILWISLIVHMSNLPLITGVILAILTLMVLINRTIRVIFQKKNIVLLFILLISWMTNPLINYSYKDGFRFSNSSNIVFFSRLLQAGAAQQYIKDKCKEDEQYYLCKYQDAIDGYNRLDVFLWNDSSILYDHPCIDKTWDACWKERNGEFGVVNSGILSHPASRKIYLEAVWKDFLLQLKSYELTTYISFDSKSHMDYPLRRYYKRDYADFTKSTQFFTSLTFSEQNIIIKWSVIVSLIIIAGMILKNKKFLSRGSPYFNFILLVFFCWVINAMLIGALAVVSHRFLGRFIWLVPLLAIVMIYQEYSRQKKTEDQI